MGPQRHYWSTPRVVLLVGAVSLVVVGLLSPPSHAQDAGDRFVATTGSDESDCASPETACRTLKGALAKAAPGATVHVAAGSYAEESVIGIDATILGAGADETELGPLSIWDKAATVTIADVAIAGGYRTGGGGVTNSGTLTLRKVVVRDNTAWAGEGFQAFGAGVFNVGTLTLEDSTVRDNTAIGIGNDERSGWGGGIHNRGSLTVTGSTISGNEAHVGGGLYNTGEATVTTSTVSGNSAKVNGGGVATTSRGSTSLAFVTITENSSDSDDNGTGDGGGVASDGPTAAMGSILAANNDPGGEAPDCSGALASGGDNLVRDPTGCELTGDGGADLTGVDALLGPLSDNGGPTLTHAPLQDSPALDVSGVDGCPDVDQRGVDRPQGDACDIGAVEIAASGPADECPCSLWDEAAEPQVIEDPDRTAVELGVRFRSDQDGRVTGVRFFKGPANTGPHSGSLWSQTGEQLATGTFTDTTESGWQELTFAEPVPITAGTTYIASYHAPEGRYSVDEGYFTDGAHLNGPLEALANDDGGNGVYRYGASGFPTETHRASNYWVDVRFVPIADGCDD